MVKGWHTPYHTSYHTDNTQRNLFAATKLRGAPTLSVPPSASFRYLFLVIILLFLLLFLFCSSLFLLVFFFVCLSCPFLRILSSISFSLSFIWRARFFRVREGEGGREGRVEGGRERGDREEEEGVFRRIFLRGEGRGRGEERGGGEIFIFRRRIFLVYSPIPSFIVFQSSFSSLFFSSFFFSLSLLPFIWHCRKLSFMESSTGMMDWRVIGCERRLAMGPRE